MFGNGSRVPDQYLYYYVPTRLHCIHVYVYTVYIYIYTHTYFISFLLCSCDENNCLNVHLFLRVSRLFCGVVGLHIQVLCFGPIRGALDLHGGMEEKGGENTGVIRWDPFFWGDHTIEMYGKFQGFPISPGKMSAWSLGWRIYNDPC